MALYRPNPALERGKKSFERLAAGEDLNVEDKANITYYVYYLKSQIDSKDKKLEEYRDFFKMLDKLLPNKNVVYG